MYIALDRASGLAGLRGSFGSIGHGERIKTRLGQSWRHSGKNQQRGEREAMVFYSSSVILLPLLFPSPPL